LIDAGAIGDVVSFRGAYYHSSATDINKPASWKQDAAICGGGVLLDLGSHILDMIYYLCGPFSAVHGVSRIVYPERVGRDGSKWRTNAEEAFYITAHLKCGAVGTVETGKVFAGTNDDLSFEIFGTKGAVRFSLMEPNWLYYYDSAADTLGFQRIECCGRYPAPGGVFPGVKAPIGWLRGHIACMHAFLSAVHSSKEASPSFSEAAHIQSVMSAAYRSAASGKTEAVMYHE